MAHSNPEFALGLMRNDPTPVSQLADLRDPLRISDMHAEIRRIQRTLRQIAAEWPDCDPVEQLVPRDRAVWLAWCTGMRRIRQKRQVEAQTYTSFGEPVGAMHGGTRRGEQFVEPKRRYPADVQAGRTKVRRGTLPR